MKRILVIEDDALTRNNIATILRMEGYLPTTAANGQAGIQAARQQRPDLILCDVSMPELDGHGVIAALRKDEGTAHIPFIFLTARSEQSDVRTGMNLGADDYLTKPATVQNLISAVEARLRREKQRTPLGFAPDFSSPTPLENLGLTPREAEILLWVAQGKSNPEISIITGAAENTVKKHLQHIFEKLGVDTRNAATVLAFEELVTPHR
jgi:DNA-binding NarL/FixJ family response regulator